LKGTCIVGIVHNGAVWLGCDSMASGEYVKSTMVAPKVFRCGDMLIGLCGTVRGRDIIEFMVPPERAEAMTCDREYIVRSFVPALRQSLRDAGYLTVDDGVETFDCLLLIAYRSRLFMVGDDFYVMEHKEWSVGSGSEYALGSLFSTSGDPQKRIRTALQAACEFSPSCGPPFVLEKL
jgi:ATP-dependent protease HslVU (ClpYQ) peptidase subunit